MRGRSLGSLDTIFAVGKTVGGGASRVDVMPNGEAVWMCGGTHVTNLANLSTASFRTG